MRRKYAALIPLVFLAGCSDTSTVHTVDTKPEETDLHPSKAITILKTADGLERSISVYHEEWLGDGYSDPKLKCEAASLKRLFSFLANDLGSPLVGIEGEERLPAGTYAYSFGDKSWPDKRAIFADVVKATEEAFDLAITVTCQGPSTAIVVTQKDIEQSPAGGDLETSPEE